MLEFLWQADGQTDGQTNDLNAPALAKGAGQLSTSVTNITSYAYMNNMLPPL